MGMTSYFQIQESNPGYTVTWPGFESVFCNTQNKQQALLDVVIGIVGVADAVLNVVAWHHPAGVIREGNPVQVLHISSVAWLQNPDVPKYYLQDLLVVGVRFDTESQALRFADHMQQRLMWKRLGGTWA
jgi:hypothetical protein